MSEDRLQGIYNILKRRIDKAKSYLNRPMTLTEKILYAHMHGNRFEGGQERGADYVFFKPDRLAMQDATAQMAILQFINAGKRRTAVPASIHCDHLILAHNGAAGDMKQALVQNKEVFDFLRSVASKYGIDFWEPGAGIIHQVVLEKYAFPGGMIIGTDSHTVNAGGLGMIAVGVGGADAVDVMAGMPWELKMPKLIGVRLTGRMNGWVSAKDVILKLAGILTVKGGANAVIEFFGAGAQTISCTGKATICNMVAEVGATSALFGYDDTMKKFLTVTGRNLVADMADQAAGYLNADPEVIKHPEQYYDRVITIDLSTLEPHINGPFTPDAAYPVSEFSRYVKENKFPEKLDAGLIGSCTNSSYEDLTRAASIARQVEAKNLKVSADFIITPGSEQIRLTAERDGLLQVFEKMGGVVMANACGPCIGQWKRSGRDTTGNNTIVTSFNRNFAGRNDGNPNTHAFVASPEMVTAMTIAGSITFNPLTDPLLNQSGDKVMLQEPTGKELPEKGFEKSTTNCIKPAADGEHVNIQINPDSDRLQLLKPFDPAKEADFTGMHLLIKTKGKCTTDHISMAGPWLKFRGHLDNISDNLLTGATNAFYDKKGITRNALTGHYEKVPEVARQYKKVGVSSIVVAEDNYGEGSSREHAAMQPRHLGVAVVLAKSFARIHETNLKKQGILALVFDDPAHYDLIREDDRLDVAGLSGFSPGNPLKVVLTHNDGKTEWFFANHHYNHQQIKWFWAGSALNLIAKNIKPK